jgi:hypothetical protein
VNLGDVEEGKHYVISWDDCCTAGAFSSTVMRLIKITEGHPEDIGFVDGVVFDNGVTMNRPFHGVVVEEV